MSFENLDLIDELLKAVNELGFVEPTPIQTDAIPEIIGGDRDLVGLAQTGTGKTAAFALPMIQLIDFHLTHTQGMVICPTRELCLQITDDIKYLEPGKSKRFFLNAGSMDNLKKRRCDNNSMRQSWN